MRIDPGLVAHAARFGFSPAPGENEVSFMQRLDREGLLPAHIDPRRPIAEQFHEPTNLVRVPLIRGIVEFDDTYGRPPRHPNCVATFRIVDRISEPMRALADELRRMYPGLHLTSGADTRAPRRSHHLPGSAGTSSPQPHEEPMSTQNPYDRREPRPSLTTRAFGREPMLAERGFMETPQAITIEDLNAMVLSARTRGAQKTADEMTMRHQEEVLAARREAWEQGRAAGVDEGRDALIKDIASTWEERANNAIRDAASALEKSDRLTKAQLAEQLHATWTLLAQMVEDHHNGFPAF